ncbi:adenylate/guanylate cyclase domain-containing protein [Acetobacter sp. DsW_063]|uniref:adenylate/guanylate cyclase domain-containing protein n=1 Tax=Acetobacter sp. DsW_063 TaxID=1514894 RepID=UPI000A38CFA9|nr:adenylate/guanylate cyclase domain-containing protein [Acetobacter sp. DsW_063]OUJ15710.1 hypothetical protein HK28_06685 [Acetobacter sp. DsW_063]
MASHEIVDPTEQTGRTTRQRLVQIGVPLLSVALILATIGGIGLHTYRSTRAGVLGLTHDLLDSVQRYVVQDVTGYLSAATTGASFAQDFIGHARSASKDIAFYAYGGSMLRLVPQLQSFYLGDEKGGFILIERDPHGKGMEYTQLRPGADGADGVFHHDFYDEHGKLLRSEENPADHYDPRDRGWFKSAIGKDEISWSSPTLYETTKQLVITSSIGLTGTDGSKYAFAINTSLNLLSQFIDSLKIGKSGKAIILDRTGHIIAGHDFSNIVARAHGDPSQMVLDPKTQSTFLQVYDRFRVRGVGSHAFKSGGKNYIGIAENLPTTDGWVLLMVAPESDFAAFARTSGRESIQFSAIIVALAAILAGLLAHQSRKTDRANRELKRQKMQTASEADALQRLADTPDLFDGASEPLSLTEALARTSHARRVAIWRLLHDGTALICDDSYDSSLDAHSGGFELSRNELEEFFKLLDAGETVNVAVASKDQRTAGFSRLMMREAGTTSLIVHPIRGASHGSSGVIGMMTLEDAVFAPHLVYFVDIVAALAAVRFGAAAETTTVTSESELLAPAPAGLSTPRFDEALVRPPVVAGQTTPGAFPSVAVMVITFSDPVMESGEGPEALLKLIDQIATEVQNIARTHELFSVKVAGHRLICIAGCTAEPDPSAIRRLAEAALALRERCMMLLSAANIEPIFSIGMDFGPALGGELGQEPKTFNLWGETVTLAELMAQGAPDVGTIEVTERVYQALRDRYLFRSRGSFYAPGSGIGRVYVLATRR